MLGPDRAEKIRIFAGDVVPRKKPDPVTSSSILFFIALGREVILLDIAFASPNGKLHHVVNFFHIYGYSVVFLQWRCLFNYQ